VGRASAAHRLSRGEPAAGAHRRPLGRPEGPLQALHQQRVAQPPQPRALPRTQQLWWLSTKPRRVPAAQTDGQALGRTGVQRCFVGACITSESQ